MVQAEKGEAGDAGQETTAEGPHGPKFVTSTTAGHWFPYGGGARICPGRHFAKRAIMSVTAIMISMFEIEILAASEAMEMDSTGYGLGMQRPIGRVAYRIRKRQGST